MTTDWQHIVNRFTIITCKVLYEDSFYNLARGFNPFHGQKVQRTFGRKICICLLTVEKRRVKHFGQRFNHLQKCHGCNLGQLPTRFDPDDDEDGDIIKTANWYLLFEFCLTTEKADEEEDTFGGKFTARVASPSSATAAAHSQPVVGFCARSREPERLEGGGGGAPHPPGPQALRLLPSLHFHVFFPFRSDFQHSNPLKAHLVQSCIRAI